MSTEVAWKDKWTFTVRNPKNGRTQDVTIPGADKLDPQRLENLVNWQTETTLAELKGPDTRIAAQPHTREFRHELGQQLREISESKRKRKETGHGKYW